jgi:hypothetical protein
VRLITAAIALLLLASPATAQITRKGPVGQASVTPDVITKRLAETARDTQNISAKGAARTAIIDFAWPSNESEYKALGKYVVVLVSAVSQSADELPLKRVYVENASGVITLQKIASIRRDVPQNSQIFAMLGPYREDSFYLAPAGAMMRKGSVMVDFTVRRSGFRLYELPGTPPAFVKADRNPMPAFDGKPDPKALKTLLEREYTGYTLPDMRKADAALTILLAAAGPIILAAMGTLRDGESGEYGKLAHRKLPEHLSLVFVPSLAALLIRAEQLNGAALTENQVLAIRDRSMVMVVPQSKARAVQERRGYADVDAADAWNSWLKIRDVRT